MAWELASCQAVAADRVPCRRDARRISVEEEEEAEEWAGRVPLWVAVPRAHIITKGVVSI